MSQSSMRLYLLFYLLNSSFSEFYSQAFTISQTFPLNFFSSITESLVQRKPEHISLLTVVIFGNKKFNLSFIPFHSKFRDLTDKTAKNVKTVFCREKNKILSITWNCVFQKEENGRGCQECSGRCTSSKQLRLIRR